MSSSQTITLTGKNLSLQKIFSEVKKQTGYIVFANKELLENTKACQHRCQQDAAAGVHEQSAWRAIIVVHRGRQNNCADAQARRKMSERKPVTARWRGK